MSIHQNEDRDLYLMLGEMRGDLKTVVREITGTRAQVDRNDKRITALEHFRTRLLAGAAVLSTVVSSGTTYFVKWIMS